MVVNTLAQCLMTKVLIERLYSREKKSAVINVGSMSSKCPSFIMAPYHATKCVGANFTIGEADNFKDKVDFLACYPAYVATAMVANRKKDFVTIDATECAENYCRVVGVTNQSFGHPKHQFFCRSGAIVKWVLGWKYGVKAMYIILRLVQRFQYKKKVITGDTAGIKRDLQETIETQHTEPAFVRPETVAQSMIDAVEEKNDDANTDVETSNCTESDMDGRLGSQKLIIQNQKMTGGIQEVGEIPYLRAQSELGPRVDSNGQEVLELDLKNADSCVDKLKVE